MYETLGETIKVIGELIIALTVLRVHHRVLHDHKVNQKVFREMKIEQVLGIVGAVMIAVGFLVKFI